MSNARLLIVEDNRTFGMQLSANLRKMGHEVLAVLPSGEEALLFLQKTQPDLILMDISLAGALDGIQTAQQVVELYDLPVVYMTGHDDLETMQRAQITSPYGYLIKPYDETSLRIVTEIALHRHPLEKRLRESEERYRLLVEEAVEGILLLDPRDWRFLEVNTAFLAMADFTRQEVQSRSFLEFCEDSQIVELFLNARLAGGEDGMLRTRLRRKQGEWLDVELKTSLIRFAHGSAVGVVVQDIHTCMQYEQREREARTLMRALLDTSAALNSTLNLDEVLDRILINVGYVVPHDAANIMLVEEEYARLVRFKGYRELYLDRFMSQLRFFIADVPNLSQMMKTRAPLVIEDVRDYPGWADLPETRWMRSYAGAPILIHGEVVGFLSVDSGKPGFFTPHQAERLQMFALQAGIALQNAHRYSKVKQLAITDALTGLYNRRGLQEFGRREIERVRRFGRPLSVLMIDIDLFKEINDTFTHAVGDEALIIVARCMRLAVREVDVVSRYGGEEFAVLLPETPLHEAGVVAERLRVLVEQAPVQTSVGMVSITVSVGAAVSHPESLSLDDLIARADRALYRAKQAGRNRVRLDSED